MFFKNWLSINCGIPDIRKILFHLEDFISLPRLEDIFWQS